jgi:hypothetical protein
MADRIQKNETREAEWQTKASDWNAIRYLDSPTDYREYLRGALLALLNNDLEVLDNSSGQVWRKLRDLTLVTFLGSIILLLILRH